MCHHFPTPQEMKDDLDRGPYCMWRFYGGLYALKVEMVLVGCHMVGETLIIVALFKAYTLSPHLLGDFTLQPKGQSSITQSALGLTYMIDFPVKSHHLLLQNNLGTYLYPAMIGCWVLTQSLQTTGTQDNDSMFPLQSSTAATVRGNVGFGSMSAPLQVSTLYLNILHSSYVPCT